MKTILVCALLCVLILLGIVLYRSHTAPDRLQVDPQAQKEIEKAKQR